jgi:hypothetical protein
MRKLKLESLQVQSFATAPAARRQSGTVHAHECPTYVPHDCGPNASAGCSEPSHESSWCTENACELIEL